MKAREAKRLLRLKLPENNTPDHPELCKAPERSSFRGFSISGLLLGLADTAILSFSMKIPLLLSIVALVFSGWSLIRSFQPRLEVEEAVEQALAKREKGWVARFKPLILPMIADLGPALEKEPETMDELMTPVLEILTKIVGSE